MNCRSVIIEQSVAGFLEDTPTPGKGDAKQKEDAKTVEARKAYSMAERLATQAEVLRMRLKKDRVADDALPLAAAAVLARKALISLEEQKAKVLQNRMDANETSGRAA